MKRCFPLLALLAMTTLPIGAHAAPSIQILNKIEKPVQENGQTRTVIETSPSGHVVKGTGVQMWQFGLMGYLFTDPIPMEEIPRLTARIGNRVFPSALGVTFEDGRYAVGVTPLDVDSLAVLRGEAFDVPQQKQLRLTWNPIQGHQISFKITNMGRTPMTLSYGTTGTDEKPARDPQLTFTATRDGKPVAASTKAMPLGNWSNPEVLGAGKTWECVVNMDDYLALNEPGHYNVKAHYTLRLQNTSTTMKVPASWNLGFDGIFGIDTVGVAG